MVSCAYVCQVSFVLHILDLTVQFLYYHQLLSKNLRSHCEVQLVWIRWIDV